MFTYYVDAEIQLQLFQPHHAKELFQLVDSNRTHLREWLGWVDNTVSWEDYLSIIPMWLQQFARNDGMNLGIRYKGELVGNIGLHSINWNYKSTTIGYYLAKEVNGKGIMTRAVASLLDYSFNELDLNRVEIRCAPKNKKSRAIPTRLGFTEEGVIRDGEYINGHYNDLVIYGILKTEWI